MVRVPASFASSRRSEPVPLARWLADDEERLRSGRAEARAGVVRDRSVSVGVGVPWPPPYSARAEREGLPLVRRRTGGTALVHLEGDLLWSIVLPRADVRVGRDFARAYDRLGTGVVSFLGDLGLRASWTPAPGLAPAYCTLSARGQVLCVGAKIVGGAAQHATAQALLHQGTVSVGVDRGTIERVFALSSSETTERLGSLHDLGVGEASGALAARLERSLREELGLP